MSRKSKADKGKVVMQTEVWPSPLIRALEISRHTPVPGAERETPLAMETAPYKCPLKTVTSALFSEPLPCLQFLKNNQLNIILLPKRPVLRGHLLLPSLPCPLDTQGAPAAS